MGTGQGRVERWAAPTKQRRPFLSSAGARQDLEGTPKGRGEGKQEDTFQQSGGGGWDATKRKG